MICTTLRTLEARESLGLAADWSIDSKTTKVCLATCGSDNKIGYS